MSRYDYFDELSNHSGNECNNDDEDDEDDDYYDNRFDNSIKNDKKKSFYPSTVKSQMKEVQDSTSNTQDNDDDDNSCCYYNRIIIHADIDCFYCQCEMIRRNITDPTIPIAIQQKHIIVTCNYPARNIGITKLMNYTDIEAIRILHPNLLIFNGSDLQYYRIYGRQIYNCFRQTILLYYPTCQVRKGCMDEMMADITSAFSNNNNSKVVAHKQQQNNNKNNNDTIHHHHHHQQQQQQGVRIYTDNGDRIMMNDDINHNNNNNSNDTTSSNITFVEDQSGVSTTIRSGNCSNGILNTTRLYSQEQQHLQQQQQSFLTPNQDSTTTTTISKDVSYFDNNNNNNNKLLNAISFVTFLRQTIYETTGFTITIGLSYNPFMSKIASGLYKPGVVNVILPPSSSSSSSTGITTSKHTLNTQQQYTRMIHNVPLRKLPGIGSRTMKSLIPCLQQLVVVQNNHHNTTSTTTETTTKENETNTTKPIVWVCGHLLRVPRNDIIRCLDQLKSNGGEKSSADQCTEIINLCNGIDNSVIIDDDGTIQKSLSVENSLRNGTIRTKEQVLHVVEDLYQRLPILIKDRTDFSDHPSLAYPTTIRVTVRSSFDSVRTGRENRKFITRSQQCKFDGKPLLPVTYRDRNEQHGTIHDTTNNEAVILLRRTITPLLHSLLFTTGSKINMTRINICVSNFQDIAQPNNLNMATSIRTKSTTNTNVKKKLQTLNDYFKVS